MRWLAFGALLVVACSSTGSDTGENARGGAGPGGGGATATGGGSAGGDEVGGAGGVGGTGGAGGSEPLPALADFSIGPYTSAAAMLDNSIDAAFSAYDTSSTYSHSAAQGYTLQAVGAYLRVSLEHEIPGGDTRRRALLGGALDEIDELMAASDQVISGGPAFGLDTAWDAFGDGSENPAFTAYTWQSGMVALGIAEVLRYAEAVDDPALHSDEQARIDAARVFLGELIDYWTPFYTTVSLGNESGGYFWYSDQAADAMAVHNTSALIAMASDIYGEIVGDTAYQDRAAACSRLLLARVSTTPAGGYTWNYVDDGYPVGSRNPEDVSHALVTTQFMRHSSERSWWSSDDMAKLALTFSAQMWSGHPARLNGRVDGSSGGDSEWTWTRAAVVGYAANGDAPGGDPALFDFARSILLSSYLTPFDRPLAGATVGAPQMLAIARLFEHRPAAFADDSAWSTIAGPGDTTVGGTRFYTVDWDDPADVDAAGLLLPARAAQVVNANLLVDLPIGSTGPVAVSITYSASADGVVEQWNGTDYVPIGSLPRTAAEDGVVRWMRTTVMLDANRFDYESGSAGTNILLQLTSTPTVHRIEATPLP